MHYLTYFLFFVIAVAGAFPPSLNAALGAGKTSAEALMNAKFNAFLQKNAMETGKAWAEAINSKRDWSREIETARISYWSAESDEARSALAENYSAKLFAKDWWFMMLYLANSWKGNPNANSSIKGYGDAIDLMTGGKIDGGILPYADLAFEKWASAMAHRLPPKLLRDPADFLNAFLETKDIYQDYRIRRDVAEFIFRNPRSLLKSESAQEFLTGWLLATDSCANLDDAEKEVAEIVKLCGEKPVQTTATTLREEYTFQKIAGELTGSFSRRYTDWLLCRSDPELYGIYLIKRWTQTDWKWSAAVLDARMKRIGRERVLKELSSALKKADDPNSKCQGDPYKQFETMKGFEDCVADELGLFTLWNDAFDVASQQLDRAQAKIQLLEMLVSEPTGESAERRYDQIIRVVDEDILLAGVHQHRTKGAALFDGIKRNPDQKSSGSEELIYILQGFSCAIDDRAFVALALANTPDSGRSSPAPPLHRLEDGIAQYNSYVGKLGEIKVMEIAHVMRAKAVRYGRVMESGRMLPAYEALKRLFGDGDSIGQQRMRAMRQEQMMGCIVQINQELGDKIGGIRHDAAFNRFYNENLRANQHDATARKNAYDSAVKANRESIENVVKAFQNSIKALEKYEQTGNAADLASAEVYKKIVTSEIETAYKEVSTDPQLNEVAKRMGYGDALKLHLKQNSGGVLARVNAVFAMYTSGK